MKYLLIQLKPHWKYIAIILIAHIVQAYTTILLPSHTSNLVDVGIQNSGFEYAVPYALTEETYETLSAIMLPEEREILQANFEQDAAGNFNLIDSASLSDEAFVALEQQFYLPLAITQMMRNLPAEEAAQAEQLLALATTNPEAVAEMRNQLAPELESLGEASVRNTGIQLVVSEYSATGNDANEMKISYLMHEGAVMLFIALITFASAGLAFYLASIVGAEVGFDLRARIFDKVLSFSQNEMSEFSTASLITRSTNDIQQLQLIVTLLLRIIIFSPILALFGVFKIFATHVSMAWVLILALGLVGILVTILFKLTMPRFNILQKMVDRINLLTREILTGLQVIRAFGRQETESNRFDEGNTDLKNTFLFVGRTMSLMMPMMLLIANIISVLIVWVGGHRIASGEMQVGEMMAFITYTMQVIFSFLMFSLMSMQIPRALVSASRIQEVLDKSLTIEDPSQPVVLEDVRGEVSFNDVTFSFQDSEEETLRNITFTAKQGETTAIIGSTGSGKSTVLSMLLRFYDPTKGNITIDGVDIRDISQEQLRDIIGFVPQKGVLFSGNIRSNISYGVDNISDELLERASEIAHASEFIQQKEEGYLSPISQGGTNVSGGQKQRLSIARAIAKQPHILVFDDSFSALDYRTDASLRSALKEEIKDVTTIIVAQRISTILDAEKIIVLDEGVIDGIGTHNELMEKSAVYRQIATSQLSPAELAEQQEKGVARVAKQTSTDDASELGLEG
ncbi:ABC transporter ATP-binding protein [Fundicoccus ignavus]|uniref:ATP-binding cassette domain-containing protein n=1 Tax=Fundicoccus ignavus TaxID=2664442 RepID=A0A844C0E1_9LACT|nr:ABC transporter ATP-binding protein [Fundicoccus ignavus]MRJ47808.1 ATP-binding cassette domain-containing protein [Fundicoccus ignavus]